MANPTVIILSGANGAGKSTLAPILLNGRMAVKAFVNADIIARGLSAFNPEKVSLNAGRIMLKQLDELAASRVDFAFETTLASRSFAPKLENWIASGYTFHLIHLWVPSAELSVARVSTRVLQGGHHVGAETIRRRYDAGFVNFFELYKPLAFSWTLLDNSVAGQTRSIATGGSTIGTIVRVPDVWKQLQKEYDRGK